MDTISYLLGVLLLCKCGVSSSNTSRPVLCENTLLTASDDFKELNFTSYQDNSTLDCMMVIRSESHGKVVHLNIASSPPRPSDSSSCSFDITAYDEVFSNNTEIWSWCAANISNVTSPGPTLLLRFQTFNGTAPDGFRLQYRQRLAQCGGSLSATLQSRRFSSPGYPAEYSNDLNCTWEITSVFPNIKLQVTDSELEALNCFSDSVTVYDGVSNKILGRFCGYEKPTYVSSSSVVRIQFFTDTFKQYKGFQMQYTGGNYTGDPNFCGPDRLTASDNINYLYSPAYPNNYAKNLHCQWNITTSVGSSIKLTVIDANITGSQCEENGVTIYDHGYTTLAFRLGSFCGTDKPIYVSKSNNLIVRFQTDGSYVNRGFKMSYQSGNFSGICGPTSLKAYDSLHFLTSPGYPSTYKNGLNCTWTIIGNPGDEIKLKVEFAHFDADGCQNDQVFVYDGSRTSAPLLGSLCKIYSSFDFLSSNNSITVWFRTDNNNVRRGFRMSYRSGHFRDNDSCGGPLSAINQRHFFRFPGIWYRFRYQNNRDCEWIITAETGYAIKVEVQNSDVGSTQQCGSDAVDVYDGSSTGASLLGRFCGSMSPRYVSTSNAVTVKIRTNGYLWNESFAFLYKQGRFNDVTCGENITAYSYDQYFSSPEYPDLQGKSLSCTWILRTSYSMIRLEVTRSDLECTLDKVAIYNGLSNANLESLCNEWGQVYYIRSSVLKIVFQTYKMRQFTGFAMMFTGGDDMGPCDGGNLTANNQEQNITSPRYPNNYANHLDCKWIITASVPNNIQLTVLDADIKSSLRCDEDIVKIYDGFNTHGPLLGTVCGNNRPRFVSSGNTLTVTFKTNGYSVGRGFKLSYRAGEFNVPDTNKCVNATMRAYDFLRYLSSPFYPEPYTNLLDCKWTISSYYYIELTVHYSSLRCGSDSVRVYDGYSTSSPLLGTFCGSMTPRYVSTGRTVTVTFKTYETNVAARFRLSYNSRRFEDCRNRKINVLPVSGILTSPSYPLQYPNNADCTWILETLYTDFVISIEITRFDLEYQADCRADYLEAFDGPNSYGRSLGKWCGSSTPSTKQSSGSFMVLKFHSNGNVTKQGFSLLYVAKDTSTGISQPSRGGAIAGGTVGVLSIAIVLIIFYHKKKGWRKRQHQQQQSVDMHFSTIPQSSTEGDLSTNITASSTGPPSYDEVIAKDQEVQKRPEQNIQPPSYRSVSAISETTQL